MNNNDDDDDSGGDEGDDDDDGGSFFSFLFCPDSQSELKKKQMNDESISTVIVLNGMNWLRPFNNEGILFGYERDTHRPLPLITSEREEREKKKQQKRGKTIGPLSYFNSIQLLIFSVVYLPVSFSVHHRRSVLTWPSCHI